MNSNQVDRTPVSREEVLMMSKAIHDQIVEEVRNLIQVAKAETLREIKDVVAALGGIKLELPKRGTVVKKIEYDEINRPVTVIESEA